MTGSSVSQNLTGQWAHGTNTSTSQYGVFQDSATNSTEVLEKINQFRFLAARSVRTSTIILAVFNTISAAALAAGIFYDCYASAKRANKLSNKKVNIFRCVRGPSVYPFFISVGIALQSITFAVAQSRGLDGLFETSCSLISEFMWPAIFVVPYLQLVFALETTIRAFRAGPFQPRGKWDVAICLAVIKIMLLITGLIGFFDRAPDVCFASLFWFVAKYAEAGFILFVTIGVILLFCVIVIVFKLRRHSTIDEVERVTASRLVYNLIMGIVSIIFVVPFFGFLTFNDVTDENGDDSETLAMISTVVVNVSGLMTGGLYLFLRSKTIATIGPDVKGIERRNTNRKKSLRIGSPTDFDYNGHLLEPVERSQSIRSYRSQESLLAKEKLSPLEPNTRSEAWPLPRTSPANPNPLRSNAVFPATALQTSDASTSSAHNRKPSYSLFPNKITLDTTPATLLPATTYSPTPKSAFANGAQDFDMDEVLQPPPSMAALTNRHKRDSSMVSSATVQIGLRFSNVDDLPPMTKRAAAATSEVFSIDSPQVSNEELDQLRMLAKETDLELGRPSLDQPNPVHPLKTAGTLGDSKMKDLPSVPREVEAIKAKTELETLSPSVYSPQSPTKAKLPSPRGVGFKMPTRSNTSPARAVPPPQRPRATKRTSNISEENRGDWI